MPGRSHAATLLLLGCVYLGTTSSRASAQFIDFNTLHGFCGASATSSTCTDNGTITPTTLNPLTQFGFTRSPDSNQNLLDPTITLEFLVPNNETATFGSFSSGSTTGSPTTVTPSLFSSTAWISGDLVGGYLGYTQTGGPTNPIGAYLPSTQGVDAGATGYFVYQAAFGTVDFGSPDPVFTDNTTLPIGTLILGLVQWTGQGTAPSFTNHGHTVSCTTGSTCVQDGTANSAALLITTNGSNGGGGGGAGGQVPEPSSVALLGTVCFGLALLFRRKTTRLG